MRILYGVQGTGNGHISRARAMARELARREVHVRFVFSGRAPNKYFDMEAFGDYRCCHGFTFSTRNGSIKYLDTLLNARAGEFMRDIRRLDVSGYDLIISDFEPVTAWAARLADRFCLGIGHQYAFNHKIPIAGDNLVARAIMRWFAPATLGMGLHWHHFGQLILPPIIAEHQPAPDAASEDAPTLVYLPFEDQQQVVSLLHHFKDTRFDLFTNDYPASTHLNVEVAPQSYCGFQRALRACAGVICNAGFELSSEALQLGKKLLVKPLAGQMEQASNAAALRELGLGATMTTLDAVQIGEWLAHGQPARVD